MKKVVLLVLIMASTVGWSMDTVRIDLKPRWLRYAENEFVQHDGSGNLIYLPVNEIKGIALAISSKNTFQVYWNDRLIEKDIKKFYSLLPELKRTAGESGMISIFSEAGVGAIETVAVQTIQTDGFVNRKATVSSFIILMGILLMACFIVLLRTQPTLTFEYLNVSRIFGLRYSEETQNLRITSVSNLFFYLFTSTLAAVILFVFGQGTSLVEVSFGQSLGQVVLLIGALLSVLLVKAVVLKLVASLFNLADFNSKQFQDYPKIWLISFGICALILTLLVMVGANWYAWIAPLQYFVLAVQLIFVGAVFLKLMGRGGFTAFHLFSYLCATEIIPLIILLNIYFF